MNKGLYLVFEGIVGSGKTTQSKKLFEYLKQTYPDKEIIWTREPGGSEIADAIRKVVQGTEFGEEMHPICEAYLYAASRAQTLRTIVTPVLEKGGIVISDNSIMTGLANQGFGRGIGIDLMLDINKVALNNLLPDKVVYLDVALQNSLSRTFDAHGDKFEKYPQEYFENVYEGYQQLSNHNLFTEKWLTVSGLGSIDEVSTRTLGSLQPTLTNWAKT